MRRFGLVLTAILGCAAATDQCTKDNSGSCCQGYTYNDTPLHKRTTAPTCDGTSIDPYPGLTAPTCGGPLDSNGNTVKPVCTAIDTIPQGSFDGTLYCGNPLANTGSGTVKGTIHVEIGLCKDTAGFCFILTATAPPGTTLSNDYKVQISTSPIASDNPGGFATKVTSQPVYVPFTLVYGSTAPCSTAKKVYIAFHAQEGSETCWAGSNTNPQTIPGGNKNWALQFDFSFTCKDVCKSWCCCPPPPTIPDCPSDYTQSCPGLCNPPKSGAQCNLLHIPNPAGWTSNPDYADKCCCKPADTPHCTSGVEHALAPGASTCSAFGSSCGNPLMGTIADCSTGNYNGACCCCTPNQCSSGTTTAGACSGSPPAGQSCTSQSDGCGGQNCCCQPTGGTCDTETAFGVPSGCASGSVCGITTLQSKQCGRWGWYIDVDLNSGPATYELHAGAGQNDLSNGATAGSVTVQPCSSGSTQWCAFFTTTDGWVLTTAHVEADCGSLSTRTTKNFPCAPGGYNDNDGGACGSGGLPGTSWKSQPFTDCPGKKYAVIFHAAVAKNDPDCTASNCGNSDP